MGGLTVLLLLAGLFSPEWFRQAIRSFDHRFTDGMFRIRGEKSTTDQVVLVDIDEKSLRALGQWPWPRNQIAQLIRQIYRHQPRVIGLDIVFPEPDRLSPARYAASLSGEEGMQLPNSVKQVDYDSILGKAVEECGVIPGYMFIMHDDGLPIDDECPFPMCGIQLAGEVNNPTHSFSIAYRPLLNIPAICQNACTEGYFNTFPDPSGMIRKVPLFIALDGTPYPSLALEMARVGLKESGYQIHAGRFGILGVGMGKRFLPTDDKAQATLNWRGAARHFSYVSAVDILENRVQTKQLAGK